MPFLASPLALLGLALLPALAAIYLLRHHARRVVVSSLIFFPKAPEASEGGRRLRRPTAPLLLLLELLAVACLALAAARPALEAALAARPLAVVLDDSLSMRAGGPLSPRERAVAELTRELAGTRHRPVVLVLSGRRSQALGPPARRGEDALAGLSAWRCASVEAHLAEGVALARELAGPRSRTLVVTDRLPAEALPADVEVLALGTPRPNLAIVDATRGPARDGGGRESVQVQVASFARAAVSASVTLEGLSADGARPLATAALSLGPLERRRLSFALPDAAGVVRVRLPADALPGDDAVVLAPGPPRGVRVEVRLTDATARSLVEKALLAAGDAVSAPGGVPQLAFRDRLDSAPPVDPSTWRCEVRSGHAGVAHAGPFLLDRRSPLLSGISFDGVVWGAAAPASGRPVVVAGDVPLLGDEERSDGGRDLSVSLVPALSTLQVTPAFPALILNLLAYRRAGLPGPERANVRAGEEVSVRVAPGRPTVPAVLAGGRRRELPVTEGRATLLAEDPGLLAVDGHPVGVNVLSAAESDLLAAASGRAGGAPPDEKLARGARDVAWVLGLLALAALAAHRLLQRGPVAAEGAS